MVIRSGKVSIAQKWLGTAFIFGLTFIWPLIDFVRGGRTDVKMLIVFLLMSVVVGGYYLLVSIAESRTITLNKSGCEISWWIFKRFYSWDEMWYRRWIEYSNEVKSRSSYEGVIWLSTAPVEIPSRGSALSIVKNDPMARVGIHFFPRGYSGTSDEHHYSFAVDMDDFIKYVGEIGIRIDNLKDAKRR